MLLFTLISILLTVPALVVLTQVAAAWANRRRPPSASPRPRVAVLIPAHNEEEVLADTLRSVRAQTMTGDRILVIADNCTDATADVARRFDAEVLERSDAKKRGKGYALAYGRQHLAQDPPEVAVVLDADCTLGPDALDRLVRRCAELSRPVQADYQLVPAEPSPRTAVSGLALLVRNKVRPLGLRRLGFGCQLTGSGMAFPWAQYAQVAGLDDHLVEDLLLGIKLTEAGHPPYFEDEAEVRSPLPTEARSQRTQRVRWEQGQLSLLFTRAPRMLVAGVRKKDWDRVVAALDLLVPPLAAWTLVTVFWGGFTFVSGLVAWDFLAFRWTLTALGSMGIAVFGAWARYGRDHIRFKDLRAIPQYVLWKLQVYQRVVFRRVKVWEKTRREAPSSSSDGPST